jgi:type II secretory pathway component PulF
MSNLVTWHWHALGRDGDLRRGTMEADDRTEVVRRLGERGLFVTGLEPRRQSGGRGSLNWADTATGLRLLARLLHAGLPVDRALKALRACAPASWGPVLPRLEESVAGGRSLSASLRRAGVLHPAMLSLIEAGEEGAGLAAATSRAADLAESTAQAAASVRRALAYPLILLGAGVASLGFLTTVVLPRFAQILAELDRSLPPVTRVVLAGAGLMRVAIPAAVVAAIAAALVIPAWASREANRLRWHGLLGALPVVGRIRRALATARACEAAGALVSAGIPVARALRIAAHACPDTAAAQRLSAACAGLEEGLSLSVSAARSRALTDAAVRLIHAGEETGELGRMLLEAADWERARVEQQLQAAARTIEPVFILGFGALVALVAAGLLQALYGMRPS